MYDRILVPTDGSPGVERAVEHAIGLAAAHGATLHAVYVCNTAGYGGLPLETSWEGVREMLAQEGESAIERVDRLAAERSVPVEGEVVDGTPAAEIVAAAEEAGCDLIVMGTHGRGGLDRILLGSVAERVVRSSQVPVLTVRVEELNAERDGDADRGEEPVVGDPESTTTG